jgi:hypothetical protein
MHHPSFRAALAVALVSLGTALSAHATSMPAGGFAPGAVPPRLGLDPHRASASPRAAAIRADGALDTTAPVLTGFSAGASVDAALAFAQLRINLQGTDDLSGINAIYVYAQGPSGQWIGIGYYGGYQAKKVAGATAFNFNVNYQPGTWTIQEVDVYDNAGNVSSYFTADLAAMGNTTFTVSNRLASQLDTAPPTFTSASILTPSISLSSHAKGTSNYPVAGMQVALTDTGTPRTSGVQYAQAYFCLADLSACFSMYMQDGVVGAASVSFKMAGQLYSPYLTAGDYTLYYLYGVDWQGNATYQTNQFFGGDTDFSTLLPGGQVITLTP